MERTDPSVLIPLQNKTDKIRNFCIIAHVDHGKTTLSDSLVSSNGIISSKLAGKLRFLDSTEEEQKRGITMHSSAISLQFRMNRQQEAGDNLSVSEQVEDDFLINLVDCPGHIDFSSDVSTATRLCDGALIIVDVLEGICTQTHAVLYKALRERLRPCLVLNKIDRLALEMQLSTVEAFHHLRRLVENVNALAFTLLNSELLLQIDDSDRDRDHLSDEEPMLSLWTFSPDKGNVVFTAAFDCWGFGLNKFVSLWSTKLGVSKGILKKYIFDDYAYNPTTKKLFKCNPTEHPNVKPMFASMILDPIWQMYDVCVTQQNPEKAAKMANRGLGIDLPPREVNKREPRLTLQSILRRWLPLADTILRMVVRCMPCPAAAQRDRSRLHTLLPVVLSPENGECNRNETTFQSVLRCQDSIMACSTESNHSIESGAPVVVFVSKMIPVRLSDLTKKDIAMLLRNESKEELLSDISENDRNYSNENSHPEKEIFVALGRVFSGVLDTHTDLYVLSSRHDPFIYGSTQQEKSQHVSDNSFDCNKDVSSVLSIVPAGSIGLYIMLGPSIHPVDSVPAGNIVGIVGLGKHVLKTATLCTTWACYPLRAMTFQSQPMVKVAIEPHSHKDLGKLEKGMQSLFQVDPVVEIGIDSCTGQHTLMCLGELHLEQCVKALVEKFARCELHVSQPLVALRETILQSDENYTQFLPPPWSNEFTKFSAAVGGKASLTMHMSNSPTAESLSMSIHCSPLPAACLPVMASMMVGSNTTHTISEFFDRYHKTCQEKVFNSQYDGTGAHGDMFGLQSSVCSTYWQSEWNSLWPSFVENYFTTQLSNGKSSDKHISVKSEKDNLLNRVLSIGSKSIGNNIMMLNQDLYISILGTTAEGAISHLGKVDQTLNPQIFWKIWYCFHNSVVAGFDLCTSAGPLMQEPLHGVCFSLTQINVPLSYCVRVLTRCEVESVVSADRLPDWEEMTRLLEENESSNGGSSMLSGKLISETRDFLRGAMLSCPLRIVEPIYDCSLQCEQSQIGNLYAVLTKRRGTVYKEEIIEGTMLFLLSAYLPVAESFGFAQELLKKTSGSGTTPQLKFSHWEVVKQDPFWRPVTAEELEEFGEVSNVEHNLPRILIDQTRKRKGLPIEEKVVVFAEKQRTLNKKK